MARSTTVAVVTVLITFGLLAGATGGVVGAVSSGEGTAVASTNQTTADLECEYPLEVEDATGETVTIEEPPERVVTTNPSAAQTMKEIGAWDRVVGVTTHAMHLDGAEEKADVSGDFGASVERIVAEDPDLVLVPNATIGGEDIVGQLRGAGLTVYHFETAETITDIQEKTLVTGQLVDECDGAEETVDWMNEELEPVSEAVEGEQQPRVLFAMDPEGGFTAGEGTFQHEMIVFAGGDNVAAEAGLVGWQEISDEVVTDTDPEWIVVTDDNPTIPEEDAYQETTAVQEDNVVVVNGSNMSQPAPRVVEPITEMAQAFHADAFEQAEETPTPTETPEETATPDTDDEGVPGFGIPVALIALALALLTTSRLRR